MSHEGGGGLVRGGKKPMEICSGVYQVAGPDMTSGQDCCVYLLYGGKEMALIDTGCGTAYKSMILNVIRLGLEPEKIRTVILTHCHIDHVGAAEFLRKDYRSRIIAHEADSPPLESGDRVLTAAFLYGIRFEPLRIDHKIHGETEVIQVGDLTLNVLHTPGHTPGSISVYVDMGKVRVLFGQDIHGPFHPDFGSDIQLWRKSMGKLLKLKADILCEGHFGIYTTKEAVTTYIEGYLKRFS